MKNTAARTAGQIGKLGGCAPCLVVDDARNIAAEWRGMGERCRTLAAEAGRMADDCECIAAALESWLEKCRKQQEIPKPKEGAGHAGTDETRG